MNQANLQPTTMYNKCHLFLIGFMGSGKTTVGKALAQQLNLPFHDLDQLVEQAAGKTVPQIFSNEGEAAFRKLESETLRNCQKLPAGIVSCGGGTPCFNGNMDFMNELGTSAYLYLSPFELAHRLLGEKASRPLIASFGNFEALYQYVYAACASRSRHYLKAHHSLHTSGKAVDEICKRLAALHPKPLPASAKKS